MFLQRFTKRNFVGIDYGTTKSGIAFLRRNYREPEVMILDRSRFRWFIPSLVALWKSDAPGSGEPYEIDSVGGEVLTKAEQAGAASPTGVLAFFERAKLALGRDMSQTRMSKEILDEFPDLQPEDVAAVILDHIRRSYEAVRGEPLNEATITIPANWSPKQRMATKCAAFMAGFQNVELVEEPIAALYYVWQRYGEQLSIGDSPETILLVDFGGGTCDTALVEFNRHAREIKIDKVIGENSLGGELIDQIILQEVNKWGGFPGTPGEAASEMHHRRKCEETKILLNDHYLWRAANILLSKKINPAVDWQMLLTAGTRAVPETDFQLSAQTLHHLLKNSTRDELKNSKTKTPRSVIDAFDDLIKSVVVRPNAPHINRVIVVGGCASLYFVKPVIYRYLPHIWEGNMLLIPDHPEECVVRGAAWHERWRWSWWSPPFQPRLFFDIKIPMDGEPIPPVIKQPRDLPAEAISYPFHWPKETDRFEIELEGNPHHTHPDDQKYNRLAVATLKGRKLSPSRHELQVKVKVSRDGIVEIFPRETSDDRVPLEPQSLYPLRGSALEEKVIRTGKLIVNFRKHKV